MRKLSLLPLAAFLLVGTGCHAKFKKHASSLGSVQTQVVNTGGVDVYLGRLNSGDGLVSAIIDTAVNVSQMINEAEVADRIVGAVDLGRTNAALAGGFDDGMGNGPPFSVEAEAPNMYQMEVLEYGMEAPYLGAQAVFTYNVRVRIYQADGERVYSARTGCSTAAGAPPAVSRALGLVSNIKQLDQMTDAEIQDAFDVVADWCGHEIARKTRKHAG